MALEYALNIKSDWNPQALLNLIVENLPTNERSAELERPMSEESYTARLYFIDVGLVSENYRSLLREELRIEVNRKVFFRLKKSEDHEQARLSVVRLTSMILQRFDGDATLVFNGDWVLLLRREGRLMLNNDLDFWTPERRSYVYLGCELVPLPMI
jgi:hypothetical protein